MKKYEYILLDWDGNLAKTLDIWLDAYRFTLEKRGIYLTDHEIGASFGSMSIHMRELGVTDVEEAYMDADAFATELLPDVELYPDALEVLEELKKRGKKTALITTSARQYIEHLLTKYDMHRLFDTVVAHQDTTDHKPHPAPLELALEKLGGSKDTTLMVGDSDKDLGAAKNFGCDSMLFHSSEHHKFYSLDTLRTYEPTYVFEDFKELLTLI